MNYRKLQTLKELIASDESNAGKSDAELLVWLTEKVVKVSLNEKQTIVHLMWKFPAEADAILDKLETAAETSKPIKRRLESMHPTAAGLDLSDPVAQAFIVGPLVDTGVLTADEADKFASIGFENISRAEDVGLHNIELSHVEKAGA